LKYVAAPPPPEKRNDFSDQPKLPSSYLVRPWDLYGDSCWNIAKWYYGNPYNWMEVYEANIDKIPERDNPDLILVGTVITLPAIKAGEERIGLWDTGKPYEAQ
jgi:nucleoid-associated protein YgaU